MKSKEDVRSMPWREKSSLLGVVGLALVLAGSAVAQDYRSLSGTNARTGRSTVQPSTAAPQTVWDNAGRGFLRWWDPIFETGSELDNDAVGTSVTGTWINPAPIGLANPNILLAAGYLQGVLADAPYRVAVTSPSSAATDLNPGSGNTAAYTWVISGLVPGDEYSIESSIPIGPTNIQPDGNLAPDFRFPSRFFGFEVIDQAGTTPVWIDVFAEGGGLADFGGARFIADGAGTITVRLYNTVQHDTFGGQIEPTDQPGFSVVYADYVQAIGRSGNRDGSYAASPVVGQLTRTPQIGGPITFDQRVVSARNESHFVGSINEEVPVGVVTSFTHNGALVDAGEPLRRNMVWSYPGIRPFDLSTAENDRYESETSAWVTGAPNTAYPRYRVFRQQDNLSAGTSFSGPFAPANVFARRGPNYLSAPASLAITGNVTWNSDMPEGDYFVEVYFPNDDAITDHATQATYEVLQGATVVATIQVNQSTANNWVRLPFQPPTGFTNSAALPLSVRITDRTLASDVTDGRAVYADAVRFVGSADLSINSTPVLADAVIDDGSTTQARDVVIVARENGRIYCMDAHGDPVTGAQPQVYWTYPSEDPATDPNDVPGEDYGITSDPTQFNLSSALVQNVGGTDLLFIGADNGKVYCLEMTGRGDGTTRRRWTYPDDFNPTAPTSQLTGSTLGPITGSVAFASVGGTDAIIVPASSGRLIALDAAGNAASKTTTELWQYPPAASPTIGEITMSPTVAFGRVYVACPDTTVPTEGVIHAVDVNTGLADWTRATRADGITPFGQFSSATPVAIPAAINPSLGADSIAFIDSVGGGNLTSLNPATGAVIWQQIGATSAGVTSALSFTNMRQYDSTGTVLVDATPTILAASVSGQLYGFYADGSFNVSGTRRIWGYFLQGEDQVASFAVGGWPNTLLANRSHIYIGDSDGLLYAFSSEDDLNAVPPITPGRPPGGQTATGSDPNEANLNGMIQADDVLLITPAQYAALDSASRNGGITAADIANLKATAIDRRHFEFGESLYLAVVDIADPTVAPTAGYRVEATLSVGTSAGRRRPLNVRQVSGAATPDDGGVAFTQIPIMPDARQGFEPGPGSLVVQAVQGGSRGARGEEVSMLATGATPALASGNFNIANPLAVRMLNNSQAGVNVLPSNPLVLTNGPVGYAGALTGNLPIDVWTNNFGGSGTPNADYLPGQRLSPSTAAEESVPHGTDAISQIQVFDRSCMFLILGDGSSVNGIIQGLRNVRWSSADMAWQPVSNPATLTDDGTDPAYPKQFDPATDLGVRRPLNVGSNKSTWAYRNFEDYPLFYPNRSVDYPDLTRGGLNVSKSELGDAGNPLFEGGVQLRPSSFTSADLAQYKSDPATYETGLTRANVATSMNVRWLVPRFQPASIGIAGERAGYAARQTIYVDQGSANGFDTSKSYRQFVLGTNVAEDVRVSTGTPTVDLGSTPTGGGFNGGAAFGPAAPWAAGSAFRPNNTTFNSGTNAQFQNFSVLNNGNTNLLNVRLSKALADSTGLTNTVRPMELFAPGEHELSWLDAGSNLFSDLDPALAPVAISGFAAPYDSVKLQKSRPGDVAPTRLSTNPNFRSNPNLGVAGGFLLNTTTFRPDDPFVGVAPPIGTPSGNYTTRVYAFEDSTVDGFSLPFIGSVPVLGPDGIGVPEFEAYTQPGMNLKFTVRETRLTNRETTKAAPNVERLLTGTEDLAWSNRQPTALRSDTGDLFVAWASNRVSNAILPSFIPTPRNTATFYNRDLWRIYLSGLDGTNSLATVGQSQLDDLNTWTASTGARWFNQIGQIPPNGVGVTLFTPTPGWSVVNTGEQAFQFHSPAFPNSGTWDPMTPAGTRGSIAETAMAFVGEAEQNRPGSNTTNLSQLMMANMTLENNGSATLGTIIPMAFDVTTKKSKPSVTRLITGGNNVYQVAYTGYSNGLGEMYIAGYSNGVWQRPIALNVGAGFEDLSSPSTVLRRYQNMAVPVIDTYFTGKLRGRQNSELFTGRLRVNASGLPFEKDPWAIFQNRFEQLNFDAKSGQYQAAGINWDLDGASLNDLRVYVAGSFSGASMRMIARGDATDKFVNRETQELTFNSLIGGKVYVDAKNGTVKLSGVALPKNSDVILVYSPRLLRVSGATSKKLVAGLLPGSLDLAFQGTSVGANYRGASVQFDDRWIGVFNNGNPSRTLNEDQNYWFEANSNLPAATVDSNLLIRHDRFMMVANRTSNDGSASTRPFMSTMRFGVELPAPVATNAAGNILSLSVTTGGPVSGARPWYQVDPVNGRIYFNSDMEDQQVTIVYDSAAPNGAVGPTYQFTANVGVVFEKGEQTVPIEQVGNESDMSVALDPFTNGPLNNRRPPLFWMFWTSNRAGVQDIFFQTIAPKTAPVGPGN